MATPLSHSLRGGNESTPQPHVPPGTAVVGVSRIVRRKEFKRKRWYRRRERKRMPFSRVLKQVYADMRAVIVPLNTPLLSCLRTANPESRVRWGGNNYYFDVPPLDPTTTRATSHDAAPVHYGGEGGGPFVIEVRR